MFYAFNGSSQHCSFDVLFTEGLNLSVFEQEEEGGVRNQRQDSLTKSKPLKLRLMALLRAASNRDVNNRVSSQEECYGRDYNVNTISDYAQ